MQNITATNPTINTGVAAPANQPVAQPADATTQDGRGIGTTLADVGKKAGAFGIDVAGKGANVLADTGTQIVKQKARAVLHMAVTDRIRDLVRIFQALPYGERLLSNIIKNFFYPYYKQVNPHTDLQPDQIAQQLMNGHTEFFEDDLVKSFDKFIQDSLNDADKAKYVSGEKKVVLIAFKNMLMNQVKTAKEPGGIKKIAAGIANWIPFVNKLPEAAKPWAGGAIGGFVGYKLLHGMWKLVKWAVLGFTGYKGFQMVKNKLGGGGAPAPDHEPGEKSKGKMASVLEGVSKMAQMAGGPGGGMMGGGGPGGGLGGIVSALAGGGGR
ncbi:MAG: hypothetical protein O3C63_08550 [Cyanobacteria bacterium]|nr:hypothetical protein [Cyanobacteriota bacterium]MDA1021508.1 hypothetical protein [Cyanobacteriota bacterium]